MRGEFLVMRHFPGAVILNRKLRPKKMPIGSIFGAQTTSAWITVKIGVCSFDFVDMTGITVIAKHAQTAKHA